MFLPPTWFEKKENFFLKMFNEDESLLVFVIFSQSKELLAVAKWEKKKGKAGIYKRKTRAFIFPENSWFSIFL